jgi:pimeloyl-ACP methyl ester carboxylesterase
MILPAPTEGARRGTSLRVPPRRFVRTAIAGVRVAALAAVLAGTIAFAQIPTSHDVAFRSGDATLAGTLTIPDADGRVPAVITISGSGPQNRDGEIPGIDGYRPFEEIAGRLVAEGVAVLRYDDRGVGASGGDHATATSADQARDVEAAVRYLQGRPEIDPLAIGLLGHSEGAMIAPMVAARHPGVAFVIALAPPVADSLEGLVTQERRILESTGMPPEAVSASVAQTRRVLELTAAEDWPALEAQLYEMVTAQLAALPPDQQATFGDLDDAADALVAQTMVQYRGWMRWFLQHDAAADWSALRVPGLAVFAGRDVQVDLEQHRSALEAAADPERVEIATVEGANHLFLRAETGSVTEYGTLEPTLMPEVLDVIADWLTGGVLPGARVPR